MKRKSIAKPGKGIVASKVIASDLYTQAEPAWDECYSIFEDMGIFVDSSGYGSGAEYVFEDEKSGDVAMVNCDEFDAEMINIHHNIPELSERKRAYRKLILDVIKG